MRAAPADDRRAWEEQVKERGIIFTSHSVRVILAGQKVQTRRVVKVEDNGTVRLRDGSRGFLYLDFDGVPGLSWRPYGGAPTQPYPTPEDACPYGVPGDRLWVRSAWWHYAPPPSNPKNEKAWDEATREVRWPAGESTPDCEPDTAMHGWKRRPSIFMPRWASRLTLEVTEVRVERLQSIREEDAKAEGAIWHDGGGIGHSGYRHDPAHGVVWGTARESFACLWDRINGKKPGCDWAADPWAWCLTFRRICVTGQQEETA
jgi:hypothetical protein